MPNRTFGGAGRYGFNGKERDKDLHSLTAYDYGFRIYNPAIGKFLSVDPLTGSYPELTPYQYASNNPIALIDIDGLEGGEPPKPGTTRPSSGSRLLNFFYKAGDVMSNDIPKGMANAGKDAVVGAYNFVRRDAWNLDTYENAVYSTSGIIGGLHSLYGNNDVLKSLQSFDNMTGTDMAQRGKGFADYIRYAPNWSSEEWSYNVTTGGIQLFGLKGVNKGLGLVKGIDNPFKLKPSYTADLAAMDYAILESMKPGKNSFRVVSAMESNGKITLDVNGSHFPGNINKNLGLAAASTEKWPLLQCAEPKALNKMLNLGMTKSSISTSTFSLKSGYTYRGSYIFKGGSGSSIAPKAPCANCNILLQGTKGR